MEEKECKKCYPGFTVICEKCGSKKIYIENSLGYSPMSGGWGSIDLICYDCKNQVEIVEQ